MARNVFNKLYLLVFILSTGGILSPCLQAIASKHPKVVTLDEYVNQTSKSGGYLLYEQSIVNVLSYNIDLYIEPEYKTIHSSVIIQVEILEDMSRFVLHLDSVFWVDRVMWIRPPYDSYSLDYIHKDGLLIMDFNDEVPAGSVIDIEVSYFGEPRSAENPPWDGGFVWAESESGQPWIGVSCQANGADLWLPVKDHPSDRPDRVSMTITVPDGLNALSNGVLVSEESLSDDTNTFSWTHEFPINNYNITLAIGPFEKVSSQYTSITGTKFPVYFWALPEHVHKAERLLPEVLKHMAFFEDFLGPYPFRSEKYGIVEMPYLGMEHQTLIAYGAGYIPDVVFESGAGFDDLHHHELAHEWWGNFLTAYNWRDFWLHEGFATYMQALYVESVHDYEFYMRFMEIIYGRILNNIAIVPEGHPFASDLLSGRDVYMKGAWVLHTLRYVIGEESFRNSLKSFLYPDDLYYTPQETPVPGRFTDTDTFTDLVEAKHGDSLRWLFDIYLKESELPELIKDWDENLLTLRWDTPGNRAFPMPVEVQDGDLIHIVIPDGKKSLEIRDVERVEIDPKNKVLRSGLFD
ncbi:M1 family metallopeptidase [Balneolaceae bacterium ANBcel3]|nr:M1 family metallopeptidase [Balneolaceae bacterium ANBcel3]